MDRQFQEIKTGSRTDRLCIRLLLCKRQRGFALKFEDIPEFQNKLILNAMSLPTCPSCGQSVLEDEALDCPFCGAAMDGSRGAKNVPKPQVGPVKQRPGAKPVAPPPAAPGAVPKPAAPARPVGGMSGPKTKVDEDDPFGIGSTASSQTAIQAAAKPDKTRLHKVTCPMCEQVGFIPKSAVGKSVRCANEKCMVPIFKATESGEKPAERRPTRLSDEAAAAKKAAETSAPTKRNPIVIYAIVGGVLLALTAGLLTILNRKPDESKLSAPAPYVPSDGTETEEEMAARLAAEAEAAAKALAAMPDPKSEVTAMAKQMIALARQPNLRDKAWARRMTADLYLKTGDATLAAQELKQLVTVDRTKAFYRIEPHVTQFWKHLAADGQEQAKSALDLALAEERGIPKIGRAGTEAALSLASALVIQGKVTEAKSLVASRRLDTTITANRDTIASVAWFWIADHSRENVIPVPSATDVMMWSEPLNTAVACDLALHQRWEEAIAWGVAGENPGVISESLSEIATIAGAAQASPAILDQIAKAIPAAYPIVAIRVNAALAAATRNNALLDSAISAMSQLSAAVAVKTPTTQQITENYGTERSTELLRATAVAEVVRAALLCGELEKAKAAFIQLRAELDSAAPPTREIRTLTLEVSNMEDAARQRIAKDLRTSNSSQVDKAFKEYRRHLVSEGNQSGLFVIAENRRLLAMQLLSRIIRADGAGIVQSALQDEASGWADEIMLDDLTGLLATATLQSKQSLPEVMQPNSKLAMARIESGHGALVARIAPVLASAWANRDKQLSAGLRALESGCGPELPGLRQAYVDELVANMARSTEVPGYLLTAIGTLQNGVWREDAYLIAGRNFAKRNMEAAVKKWTADQRMNALEQITLMYGMAQVIAERPSK